MLKAQDAAVIALDGVHRAVRQPEQIVGGQLSGQTQNEPLDQKKEIPQVLAG